MDILHQRLPPFSDVKSLLDVTKMPDFLPNVRHQYPSSGIPTDWAETKIGALVLFYPALSTNAGLLMTDNWCLHTDHADGG